MGWICILGDSIAFGRWDEEGGWADRLKREFPKDGVFNLAIPGDTTRHLLQRIKPECSARDPDAILFAIGVNDAGQREGKSQNEVPREEFEKNLAALLTIAKGLTENVGFVGIADIDDSRTIPVPWEKGFCYHGEKVREYDAVLEEFCERMKVPYLDLSGTLGPQDLCDGIHPNAQGHEKLARKIRPLIEKLLHNA